MKKYVFVIVTLLFLFFFVLISLSYAQGDTVKPKKQFPLELSFFNHATSRPFNSTILHILHPGFSLGTEYVYWQGRSGKLYQNLNAGYYYNEYIAKALFLQTSAGYRYTTGFGLFGDATLGLGYHLSFHPGQVFKLNSEGEYESAKSPGRSALLVSASIGAGYDFSRKVGLPMSFFVRYQPFFQTPYNFRDSWLVQAMLHVGIRLYFR